MNITARVFIFGIVSGLIWALALCIPDGFGSARETVNILVSGVLSGISVSFALKRTLTKFGWFGGFVIGLIALPLGAFFFGVFGALLEIIVGVITGGTHDFNPFLIGLYYAAMSMASVFVFLFLPFSILTTFILRAIIHFGRESGLKSM